MTIGRWMAVAARRGSGMTLFRVRSFEPRLELGHRDRDSRRSSWRGSSSSSRRARQCPVCGEGPVGKVAVVPFGDHYFRCEACGQRMKRFGSRPALGRLRPRGRPPFPQDVGPSRPGPTAPSSPPPRRPRPGPSASSSASKRDRDASDRGAGRARPPRAPTPTPTMHRRPRIDRPRPVLSPPWPIDSSAPWTRSDGPETRGAESCPRCSSPADPPPSRAADQAALKPFAGLVGEWKGTGQPQTRQCARGLDRIGRLGVDPHERERRPGVLRRPRGNISARPSCGPRRRRTSSRSTPSCADGSKRSFTRQDRRSGRAGPDARRARRLGARRRSRSRRCMTPGS